MTNRLWNKGFIILFQITVFKLFVIRKIIDFICATLGSYFLFRNVKILIVRNCK